MFEVSLKVGLAAYVILCESSRIGPSGAIPFVPNASEYGPAKEANGALIEVPKYHKSSQRHFVPSVRWLPLLGERSME